LVITLWPAQAPTPIGRHFSHDLPVFAFCLAALSVVFGVTVAAASSPFILKRNLEAPDFIFHAYFR
jgi:hypothetical protein